MVTIKHKVTIKTKTAQEETPVAIEAPKNVTIKKKTPEVPETPKRPQTPPTPPEEPNGDSKAWIWIVLLVVAAIIAFFCFKNCGNKENAGDEGGASVPPKEQVDSNQNKETPEANADNEEGAEENAGSDETDKTPNTPDEPKVESNNGGQVAPAAQPEKKNDTPVVPAKQEKKQTTSIPNPSAQVSGDLEENARQVIRGVFGNGQERKDKLGAAYAEIQGKVNEMYRQGLVH